MSQPEEFGEPGVSQSSVPDGVQNASSAPAEHMADNEYHYSKADFESSVYSDAHFEPAGSRTEPPRYYTPPEKPARPARLPREKKGSGFFLKALCLCLICALLGGAVGAYAVNNRMSARMEALEQGMADLDKKLEERPAVQAVAISDPTGTVAAAQIFSAATEQVVGITTEVTYQNFFGMTSSSAVSGSGFILSEDGYILTNYHVIEYACKGGTDVTVMLYDGTEHTAAIVGVEEGNDIAVLKIDAAGLNPVNLGDSDGISMGEKVYAVGNPLGELSFSMSTGYVSGLDRVISTQEGESINMFQIDAPVNPGNSGGPVYNALGQVIGVVTAKYRDDGVEGLGFAIPIDDAASIANDLITKGYVTGKAYMGVGLDNRWNSMYALYYNMPLGAYVYFVESGSAAEEAGIRPGDIITALGDSKVESYTGLKQLIRQYSAGDSAQVTVYRAGEFLTLDITFQEARPGSDSDNPANRKPTAGDWT